MPAISGQCCDDGWNPRAYAWSGAGSLTGVRDHVWAALTAARQAGWGGLLAEQRQYLDAFWDRADVEVDGDAEVQQAVRFALFQVLQAGARAENGAIPAKGLTGPGYSGHTFWDTEIFVLPMFTFTTPDAAASAARWRHSTLPLAIDRAAQLGLHGAAFPWRTITGPECSGYWPAGTAAFHVNADIAVAAVRYTDATGDEEFAQGTGMDLLVHTARLWSSLGHHDAEGRFHIDGVTGPDEYSALADDNIYTNLMAQRNLLAAADAAKRYPDRARELGVSDQEPAGWRDAAEAMTIPYDEALGVHAQAAGFTRRQVWDFARTSPQQYPLMLHFPYFDLYRKQVIKQADLVLAMQMHSSAFTPEQKARDFAYYERLTVRDSSLSACSQAVIAAETGHLDLAYDFLGEAALIDLRDLEHNTRDGLHIAFAGRHLDRAGQRLRRAAPPGRDRQRRAAALRRPDPARVHPVHRWPAPASRGHARPGQVHPDRRRPARNPSPRPSRHPHGRETARPADPDGAVPAPPQPAGWPRAGAPPAHRERDETGRGPWHHGPFGLETEFVRTARGSPPRSARIIRIV
jgi:alpha,alpha-trehalose phosphorylase